MNDLSRPDGLLAPAPRDGFAPAYTVERIVAMRRPAADLVRFETTRPPQFRFTPGHYGRLGLGADEAIVWRPYSIASPGADERLAFHFTRVPGGAFNGLFERLAPGDPIRIDRRSFGFLTLAQVAPGGVLWLVATGTGIVPFVSLLADGATWARHDGVVVVHSVRHAAELATAELESAAASRAEARGRLRIVPVVTRERMDGALDQRIGELLRSGTLESAAGRALDAAGSRLMVCGNPEMIRDVRALARERGLEPGRRGVPGGIATEGYW
jgi:ferredoxin/flavodoxin---NADP+ reductase